MSQISRDLRDMAGDLTKRIADVGDQSSATDQQLREQLLAHGREMNEHILARHRELGALLEQRFQELRKDKTDRSALASLFSEVALRLNDEFHIPGLEH